MIKIRLAAALLLPALLLPATVQAGPSADWIKVPGATAWLVKEPVFGGRIAVYRAGPLDARQAVVLVHGLGKAAARDWENLIPALALVHSARAWALLEGRDKVIPEDVQAILPGVAAHRLRPAHDSSRRVDVGAQLLAAVPIP